MKYELYQSPGSSRWNVRSINKAGKAKFLRGFRTKEEAEFFRQSKERGANRKLV
jgi:hypothetical protein